ncbi:MAG: hypothetical protein J5496_05315, partial [Lachnospiraceae bacterium]|nr:hypothetical protein [Lachnospiraceae bacterium]
AGRLVLVLGEPGTSSVTAAPCHLPKRGRQAAEAQKEILEKIRPVMEERPRGQQIGRVKFEAAPLPRTQTGKLKRWEIRYE